MNLLQRLSFLLPGSTPPTRHTGARHTSTSSVRAVFISAWIIVVVRLKQIETSSTVGTKRTLDNLRQSINEDWLGWYCNEIFLRWCYGEPFFLSYMLASEFWIPPISIFRSCPSHFEGDVKLTPVRVEPFGNPLSRGVLLGVDAGWELL